MAEKRTNSTRALESTLVTTVDTPDKAETGHMTPYYSAQLVRTDGETLRLDGTRLDTLDREHGRAPALKLSRTDRSTIGLDGRVLSPPRARALSHLAPSRAPTRPTQPPPTKPTTNKPPAPKRRAVVSKARVNALRKEQNSTAHNVVPGLPAKSASVSSKSAPKPARPA
ncbi:hypothetical protein FRC07_010288 [Ceratobasidium sp. 392]|nr:hypothetical protein FRC07_010288 [Ceratobasidium sp. 392]